MIDNKKKSKNLNFFAKEMMNRRLVLISVLVLLASVVECKDTEYRPFNARLAKFIFDYFHLERLETLPENQNESMPNAFQQCSAVRTIEDYFFKVYGSEIEGKNFTLNALDNLLHYHLRKSRRSENEEKHLKYKCNRKTVINTIFFKKLYLYRILFQVF
jgi:hypothetical protein